MAKKYATEQRKRLMAFLKENPDQQFTVDEIADQLCTGEDISVSSIYRNINAMVTEGSVGRFNRTGIRHYVYQYIDDEKCSKHIHLQCKNCGQLFHVGEEAMGQMLALIEASNKFNIDVKKTIMYGVCQGCEE